MDGDRIYRKPYRPTYVVSLAREMRKQPTPTEVLLWEHLRGRRFMGLKFRRQVPFGRYVIDFYCPEKMLGIELDGTSHDGKEAYDRCREKLLGGIKIRIVRFRNEEVLADIEKVLDVIQEFV